MNASKWHTNTSKKSEPEKSSIYWDQKQRHTIQYSSNGESLAVKQKIELIACRKGWMSTSNGFKQKDPSFFSQQVIKLHCKCCYKNFQLPLTKCKTARDSPTAPHRESERELLSLTFNNGFWFVTSKKILKMWSSNMEFMFNYLICRL